MQKNFLNFQTEVSQLLFIHSLKLEVWQAISLLFLMDVSSDHNYLKMYLIMWIVKTSFYSQTKMAIQNHAIEY